MSVWIAIAVLALLGVAAALLVRVRIEVTLQGLGEPDGAWALAGGVQLGWLTFSGAAARGVAPRFQAHFRGRPLRLPKRGRRKPPADEKEDGALGLRRVREAYSTLERWIDPLDLALFLTRERRRIALGELELELDYSFEDVALTGKLLAAISVLTGVFPGALRISQNVSWESVDRARASFAGSASVRPGLLIGDCLVFVLRNLKYRGSNPRWPRATSPTS